MHSLGSRRGRLYTPCSRGAQGSRAPTGCRGSTAPSRRGYPDPVLENFWANAVFSVTPTILVGLIFWLVIRSIFRADRTERKAYSEIEAEERAKRGLPPQPSPGAEPSR